jgi:TRAP-type C4-dicarboxylate transport system permease small subunit
MTDSTPPPKPRRPLLIATAILVTTLIISLGLCGMTMSHANFNNMPASATIELLGIVGSIVGLFIVALIAIIRAVRRSRQMSTPK